MIDFLIWNLSTQPGLALNFCFSRLSLLSAKMAFHPVLVLSEEADLWSAKPLSGLYIMACKRKKTKCLGSWLLWTQSNAFRIHGDFELSFSDWAHDVPEERERLLIFCAAFSPASVSVQNRVRSNTVASGDKSIWSKILTGWGFTLRSKALACGIQGKPSQVTCLLEAEGELRQIGRAAILERQPLR